MAKQRNTPGAVRMTRKTHGTRMVSPILEHAVACADRLTITGRFLHLIGESSFPARIIVASILPFPYPGRLSDNFLKIFPPSVTNSALCHSMLMKA